MDREEAFKQAVLEGDLETVRRCLDEGVDPNLPINAKRGRRETYRDLTPDGFNALHVAAYEDDAALGQLLLERGAEPWAETRFMQTPLMLAADWGSPAFVRVFLDAGIDPDATGRRPIVAAAGKGHREIVAMLLAAGARNGAGIAIQSACSYDASPEIVTQLLDAGAKPEVPADPTDWTARVSALYSRNEECLRILAERTQPRTLVDAAIDGRLDVVDVFLASGADPNATLKHRIAPLVAAASQGHAAVVTRLLDAGAEINHHAVIGTALERALRNEHLHVASLLHERGAQFSTKRFGSVVGSLINSGVSAEVFDWIRERHKPKNPDALLGRAALGGDFAAVDALLAMGASIDGRDGWGRPPLAVAAWARRTKMVEYLLARGADPKVRDQHGRSLLHYVLVYDDYTDDWLDPDFDESRYNRDDPVLQGPTVRLLLDAGTPLPWSDDD